MGGLIPLTALAVWQVNWYLGHRAAQRAFAGSDTPMLDAHLARDPPLGATLPIPRADEAATNEPGSRQDLVLALFVGTCNQCYQRQIEEWESRQQELPQARFLLVTPDTLPNRREWLGVKDRTLPLVFDKERELQEAYNAFFVPRAYLIDGSGRLLWLQKQRNVTLWEEVARILELEGRTLEEPVRDAMR